jgi:ring-1,2-phenylacetyl-CoA epoxidase subunit PaaC
MSNIALDLVGQARNFYQYAALVKDDGATEDSLAYLRDAREFKNLLITELPNGDWAQRS